MKCVVCPALPTESSLVVSLALHFSCLWTEKEHTVALAAAHLYDDDDDDDDDTFVCFRWRLHDLLLLPSTSAVLGVLFCYVHAQSWFTDEIEC